MTLQKLKVNSGIAESSGNRHGPRAVPPRLEEGDREESYRRKWRGEESRVQAVAEETKSRLKIVRDHLIATLDNVDVSNRTMMDTMDELMKVDRDMSCKYGDVLPNSGAAVPAPQ